MAETHDTIKGLLAEFRGYSAGMPASYHVTMSWADFRRMLDRFEAALKREVAEKDADITDLKSRVKLWTDRADELRKKCDEFYAKSKAVGDCAKLREALNLCVDEMCARCRDLAKARGNPAPCLNGCEPVRKAKAALAEPIKNCEVGTAEEQEKRFHDFCRARHLPRMEESRYCAYKCPLEGDTCCELQWAQMPYVEKEGGAK